MSAGHPTQTIVLCEDLIRDHRHVQRLLDRLKSYLEVMQTQQEKLLLSRYDEIETLIGDISDHIHIHFACEERGLFPAGDGMLLGPRVSHSLHALKDSAFISIAQDL